MAHDPVTKRIAVLSKGNIKNVKLDGVESLISQNIPENKLTSISFRKKKKLALVIELSDVNSAKIVYDILDGQEIENILLECYFMDEKAELGEEIFTEKIEEVRKTNTKKSERKKQRKEKMKREIEERLNRKNADGFIFDPSDARFGKVYTDPNFFIDASHPLYRNNSGAEMMVEEMKRRNME
ncbi:hypothetical protein VCUG_00277 [Vavraia culicis subsp. floridensis]|uniref:NUC153 domain-containing protein n=1 Tax=Vavraia culicis (isolate floridensis) TaxID=948595 RepID=L2GX28_VAVCU|nr:uncharacterized protein VCUG_00277 [Vavraia culicis subsp. floridensis]ELA48236.1 hypothetical protein VCUG_00277 [Vavraia culicis subsp. floridensis]